MAFVTRSERKMNINTNNSTNIGPGEYENDEIKEEARLLHKISNKYSHYSKNNDLNIVIPFNTTGVRSNFIKENNTPGPGTYTGDFSYKKSRKEDGTHSMDKEIIFVEENGSLVPKLNKELKGFLSSEKRFNDSHIYDNKSIGPGSYELIKTFNKTKNNYNTRYGKVELGRAYKSSGVYEDLVPTIPDKNRGDFKYVNGQITEIKKMNNGNVLGPGQYNIFPKWANNALDWKIGLKMENKNKDYKNEIINSLNKSSLRESQMKNTSNSKLNKSMTKIKSGHNLLEENQNNIRNLVFKRYLKYRKNMHDNSLNKIKEYNDKILDLKYKDTPGPGAYDSKILKGQTNHFNINKSQNFGSNSPKFFKIETENDIIGPGSYFLEKNKYEPKFETIMHLKKTEKNNDENENKKEIGAYLNNFRNKNTNKQPGPGQYDIEKDFIKKETSNVKSFGTLSERFKRVKSLDKKENKENKDEKKEYKYKINYKFEDRMLKNQVLAPIPQK